MDPQDQALGFLDHDETLVETLEALTPEQRDNLKRQPWISPRTTRDLHHFRHAPERGGVARLGCACWS